MDGNIINWCWQEESNKLTNGLKADTSAIEELKDKVSTFAEKVKRTPTLTDFMIILSVGFVTVGIGHFGAEYLAPYFKNLIAEYRVKYNVEIHLLF